MSRLMLRSIGFALVMTCLLLSLGCAREDKPKAVSKVKIGVLFPLSGDLAEVGKNSTNVIKMAIEDVNTSGGIAVLGGAKIEPLLGDTQGQPEVGVRETGRLVAAGAVAIIGAYQSSVTMSATQKAERLETPFVVSMSIADAITELGNRYSFRIAAKSSTYARDQVRFLTDLQRLAGYRVQRVALLHENTDFGTSTALAQKAFLQKSGMVLAMDVAYRARGITDLSAEVAQIMAARPDVILTTSYQEDSILIRQALAKAGAKIPLVDTSGGTISPAYIPKLGPLAEGVLALTEYTKYARGCMVFNERYRARSGLDLTGDSACAYQSVWVLKDALERARTTDRKRLRMALAATDMPRGPHMILPIERLRFDAQGQNKDIRLFVVQIQNGQRVPVWPAQDAIGTVWLGR